MWPSVSHWMGVGALARQAPDRVLQSQNGTPRGQLSPAARSRAERARPQGIFPPDGRAQPSPRPVGPVVESSERGAIELAATNGIAQPATKIGPEPGARVACEAPRPRANAHSSPGRLAGAEAGVLSHFDGARQSELSLKPGCWNSSDHGGSTFSLHTRSFPARRSPREKVGDNCRWTYDLAFNARPMPDARAREVRSAPKRHAQCLSQALDPALARLRVPFARHCRMGVRRQMQMLEQITYDAGRQALADQESLVAGIQQRTGTLLAAHALVASFLGGATLRDQGCSWLAALVVH